MQMPNGSLRTQKYEGIVTFFCEGCKQRFPAEKLYKANYRADNSDPINGAGVALRNHVCSKKCSGIATAWKAEHHQTLEHFVLLERERLGLPEEEDHKVFHKSKIGRVEALRIRLLRRDGKLLHEIAVLFHISDSSVSRIVHYKRGGYL